MAGVERERRFAAVSVIEDSDLGLRTFVKA